MKKTTLLLIFICIPFFGFSQDCLTVTRDITNPTFSAYFGHGSFFGDVNNDGIDDVLISHEVNMTGQEDLLYVILGPLTTTTDFAVETESDFTISVPQERSHFSSNIDAVSKYKLVDFNGDSVPDLFVEQFSGAHVYFGPLTTAQTTPDITYTLSSPSDTRKITTVGDITGNGSPDIIVADVNDPGTALPNSGRVYIFEGPVAAGSLNLGDSFASITGVGNYDYLGASIMAVPDLNGDSFPELYIQASEAGICVQTSTTTGLCISYDFREEGVGYIFKSPITAGDIDATAANITLDGEGPLSLALNNFGKNMSFDKDFNGDGELDFAVTAAGINTVYVFNGPIADGQLSAANAIKITGNGSSEAFGFSMVGVNDIDGDGFDELVVGDSQYSLARGRTYLFTGPLENTTLADGIVLAEGVETQQFVGQSTVVGDINNDGFDDVGFSTFSQNSFPDGLFDICSLEGATAGVEDLTALDNSLAMYPNPAKNSFSFTSIQPISKVSIYSFSGQLIKSVTISNTEAIDVSSISKGMYLVKFEAENGLEVSRKLLVTK